jgi:hypothetical protein
MPFVHKSSAVEVLDAFFGPEGDLEAAYGYSQRRLEENVPLLQITEELASDPEAPPGMGPVSEQAGVFFQGWLQEDFGEHVDEIMRDAYAKAIELATDPELKPIETFWITHASDDFEMHVVDTALRVNVFVFVPRDDTGSDITVSRSWKVHAPGGIVQTVQVSGPGRQQVSD